MLNGYVIACQNRTQLFSENDVSIIFGNLPELYTFQEKILQNLEAVYKGTETKIADLADIFTENGSEFEIYSTYCNNHPCAVKRLQTFQEHIKYRIFFEKCRLSQNMIEIDLAGFLLTPIQRICKYPLQLQELLKTFDESDPDFSHVESAISTMKKLANEINERKRKHEERAKIQKWQSNCLQWRGADVLEHSSRLIYSGEMTRSYLGRRELRTGFLFDGQLVLVKSDGQRKRQFYFRERIDIRYCEIELKIQCKFVTIFKWISP